MSSGGDAGFPAPGTVGTTGSAALTGGSSGFVPMGTSGQSNFVPMGASAGGGGNGLSIPRPVARQVRRTSRQVGNSVNSMINRSIYRSMNSLRF